MPPHRRRRKEPPKKKKPGAGPPVSKAQKAVGAVLGRSARQAKAAARQAAKAKVFESRVIRFLERMNLQKAVQPSELMAARDLGMYLLLTPRETAEVMHKIYTDRRRRADFQRKIMAYPQIRRDEQQFHQLANYFAGIAVKTGVVKLK